VDEVRIDGGGRPIAPTGPLRARLERHEALFWWLHSAYVLALGAGCSGINHTQSVSPATFFLPGLLQVEPPPPHPDLIPPTTASPPIEAAQS